METYQAIQQELDETSPEFQAYVNSLRQQAVLAKLTFAPIGLRPVRICSIFSLAFTSLLHRDDVRSESDWAISVREDAQLIHEQFLTICEELGKKN